MIDPKLMDWWSGWRVTQLKVSEGSILGDGIPLRVILPAVVNSDLVWFSKIWGDFDDNVLLIGCSPGTTLEKRRHEVVSPIRRFCDVDLENEYAMTDSVCSALQIGFYGNGYNIGHANEVAFEVKVHDDCFSYVRPVDNNVLTRLLNRVLEQHSFYLGKEVDWSEVAPHLVNVLLNSQLLKLQSNPRRSYLRVVELERSARLFWPTRRDTIRIVNGKAAFRPGVALVD